MENREKKVKKLEFKAPELLEARVAPVKLSVDPSNINGERGNTSVGDRPRSRTV